MHHDRTHGRRRWRCDHDGGAPRSGSVTSGTGVQSSTMVRPAAVLAAAAVALALAPAQLLASDAPPMQQQPPRMSAVQKRVMAQTAAAAKVASDAATAPLEKLLAAPEFTASLGGCCPELAGRTPSELLAMYAEQVAVTEVAHGFFAVNPPAQNNAADVNLTQAANATWFYNEWQLQVLFPDYISFWEVIGGSCSLGPAAAAELGIFGLPPFSAPIPRVPGAFPGGWPASLAEASDRVVYTLFNQRRSALPTAPWGDVSVIFAPSLTQDVVLLSPFDTGDYEVGCNHTYQTEMNKAFERDCALQKTQTACQAMGYMCTWNGTACGSERSSSVPHKQDHQRQARRWQEKEEQEFPGEPMCNWTLQMGTMQHHNHVLLDNVMLSMGGPPTGQSKRRATTATSGGATQLGALFKGMFEPLSNRTDGGFTNDYFEAELLGTAAFPEGVHMILAGFDSLFGSEAGEMLQNWCEKWQWPLVWTREGGGWSPPSGGSGSAGPQRLLDPVVLQSSAAGGNYSAAAKAAATSFNALWKSHKPPAPPSPGQFPPPPPVRLAPPQATHTTNTSTSTHARRSIQQLRVVQFITISCVAKTACQMVNLTIVNVCRRLVAGLRWSKS